MTSLASEWPDWPTLTGRQEAEYLLVDEGDQSEAERALTFYKRINKPLMPWQRDSNHGILALEPDGLFTHPTVVEIATRQSGKTLSAADLRILWGLFGRGERIVYSAQRWKTAESIFNRINRIIKSRPSLNRRVVRRTCSQGQASFELESGAKADFITRSLDSGRGLDEIDLIIYDEAYNLTDAETAALSPTQMASKNPQTIYLSSAVNQENHANGRVLAKIRHVAHEAIKVGKRRIGLYFREHMAPEPPEGISDAERRAIREDPETWRLASPSYGVIQTEAKVRKLLTELSAKDFEVEILGWGDWPPVDDAALRVFGEDLWRALCKPSPELFNQHPRVLAVDRSPKSKVWAIGGAQHVRSGGAHVEIGWSGLGSATEVAERLIDNIAESDPVALVIDQRSPAAVLKPYLIEAGIEPVMTNTTQLALYCEGFYDAFEAQQITHSGQQILTDSVTTATKRDLPGGRYAWDGSQIVQLMAVTLAHGGLLEFSSPPTSSPPPLADQLETSGADSDDAFDAMSAPF
ncbi:hypothetical protein AWC11_07255 [Mycobacterium interjectum]|nr:hypothetical protein AWC11_07255 [Mycobacterium interjectum]